MEGILQYGQNRGQIKQQQNFPKTTLNKKYLVLITIVNILDGNITNAN